MHVEPWTIRQVPSDLISQETLGKSPALLGDGVALLRSGLVFLTGWLIQGVLVGSMTTLTTLGPWSGYHYHLWLTGLPLHKHQLPRRWWFSETRQLVLGKVRHKHIIRPGLETPWRRHQLRHRPAPCPQRQAHWPFGSLASMLKKRHLDSSLGIQPSNGPSARRVGNLTPQSWPPEVCTVSWETWSSPSCQNPSHGRARILDFSPSLIGAFGHPSRCPCRCPSHCRLGPHLSRHLRIVAPPRHLHPPSARNWSIATSGRLPHREFLRSQRRKHSDFHRHSCIPLRFLNIVHIIGLALVVSLLSLNLMKELGSQHANGIHHKVVFEIPLWLHHHALFVLRGQGWVSEQQVGPHVAQSGSLSNQIFKQDFMPCHIAFIAFVSLLRHPKDCTFKFGVLVFQHSFPPDATQRRHDEFDPLKRIHFQLFWLEPHHLLKGRATAL